jgi:hypothetical protein
VYVCLLDNQSEPPQKGMNAEWENPTSARGRPPEGTTLLTR